MAPRSFLLNTMPILPKAAAGALFMGCLLRGWLIGSWVIVYYSSRNKQRLTEYGFTSSVQSLSHVWLFATPWTAACQASLSITNSWSVHKLMTTESVMPSSITVNFSNMFVGEIPKSDISKVQNYAYFSRYWQIIIPYANIFSNSLWAYPFCYFLDSTGLNNWIFCQSHRWKVIIHVT